MHRLSLTLMLLASAVAMHAEEPGNIYLPGVEDLDDAGKALYARANEDVKKSYHALLDKNDPVESERLMQDALAILGTLSGMIGDSGPGGNKVGIYGYAKKNRNVVEGSGGLDGIAEMEMKSLTVVTDYDFHLHHRAVLANFASQAKDVLALQKFIIKEIHAGGNTKSFTGGAQQRQKQKPDKQEPKGDKDQPDPKEKEGDQLPRRLSTSDQQQPQDQDQKKQDGGPTTQSALLSTDKPQQNQQSPDQKKMADGKDLDGKAPPDAKSPANPPDAKAQVPTLLPNNPAKAPNANGAPNPGQPNLNPDGTPNSDPTTPLTTEQLAQKQDQVANWFEKNAEKLKQQGGQENTANAFRAAADAAKAAAAAIRSKDQFVAANAAAAAEKSIALALATARGDDDKERQQQTAALASAISGIQDLQTQVVAGAKKLIDDVAAGTISKQDAQVQGAQLSSSQAEIKQAIDTLGKAIDTLAKASPDTTSPNSQAIHENLKSAANALHDGRAPQEAVNATINLEQGHTDQALSAIARETNALDQVHARLNAAADAAAGGHGSDQQALNNLQRLSTALRQLEKTTQAGLDGQQQADGKKPDLAGADAQKNNDANKTAATTRDDAHANSPPPAQLPAELGNAIDSSMKDLANQIDDQLKKMPQVNADQKARISALTRQRMPIAKDPGATLEHMRSMVAEVEGIEADLTKRISEDQSHAALQTFLKDPVPAAYRASVADYYQLLADDMSMSSSSAPPAKAAP